MNSCQCLDWPWAGLKALPGLCPHTREREREKREPGTFSAAAHTRGCVANMRIHQRWEKQMLIIALTQLDTVEDFENVEHCLILCRCLCLTRTHKDSNAKSQRNAFLFSFKSLSFFLYFINPHSTLLPTKVFPTPDDSTPSSKNFDCYVCVIWFK